MFPKYVPQPKSARHSLIRNKSQTAVTKIPGCKKNCSNVMIQYNTIRVYCENTLSYNNGVLSQTEPKSGSVKARQLIYRYSTIIAPIIAVFNKHFKHNNLFTNKKTFETCF